MNLEMLEKNVFCARDLYNMFKDFTILREDLLYPDDMPDLHEKDEKQINKMLDHYWAVKDQNTNTQQLIREIRKELCLLDFKLKNLSEINTTKSHELYPPNFRATASKITHPKAKQLRTLLRGKEAKPTREPIRICHISDLHLGAFHFDSNLLAVPHDCRVLNALISFFRQKQIRPHFLIFTGDIASRAEKKWFDYFRQRLEELTRDPECPIAQDKMIILHGNHDMFRPRGKSASSTRFQNAFPGAEWNTVFSPAKPDLCVPFADGRCSGAVYVYPVEGFAAIAFDSCRFIGSLDPDVLDMSKTLNKVRYKDSVKKELGEKLNEIIRLDYGTIPQQYVQTGMRVLKETLAKQSGTREEWFVCGLLHHNVTEVRGIDQELRQEYAAIVSMLLGQQDSPRSAGVNCVLHGHVHKASVDVTSGRFISVSSLGALQAIGEIGLSIIEVDEGYPGEHRHATLKRYKLGTLGFEQIPNTDYAIPVGN